MMPENSQTMRVNGKHAELVQIIHKKDMWQTMFNLNIQGPDDEQFMTGMSDLMLGTAPFTAFGFLIAFLVLYMGRCIHEVTTAMATLGEVEGRCCGVEGRSVCVIMPILSTTEKKMKGHKQALFGLPECKCGLIC